MAMNTHIKFDGIDGESTNKDHKGEVEVLTWNWGASLDAAAAGSGRATGKARLHEFRFVHRYDKASPALFQRVVEGRRLKEVVVTARKSGEGQKEFLKVTFKDVVVSSVNQTGDLAELTEEVTLQPASISIDYRPQDAKGGVGTSVTAEWSARSGSKIR